MSHGYFYEQEIINQYFLTNCTISGLCGMTYTPSAHYNNSEYDYGGWSMYPDLSVSDNLAR